jgi:hypothetical protein
MVSFMAKRQGTLAVIMGFLLLLAALLLGVFFHSTPALAQATVTLDPTSGPPGTQVTATGSGWTPGREITVRWDDTDLTTTTVDSSGGFTVSFSVPENASLGEPSIFTRQGLVVG